MRPAALARMAGFAALPVLLVATPALAGGGSGSVRARVGVDPLAVDLALSTYQAHVGDTVAALVTVHNRGTSTVKEITVRLRTDPTAIVAFPRDAAAIQRLAGGRSAAVDFSLCAEEPGQYLVLAQARTGAVATESPARLLGVTLANDGHHPTRPPVCAVKPGR